MRVLLINAKPVLVEALAALGVDAIGVWPQRQDFPHWPEGLRRAAQFYSGGAKFSPRAAREVRQLIRTHRPDVVHAFYGRALAHVNLATTGLAVRPKIVSFRGITSPLSRLDPGDWLSYRHPHVDAHACESDAVRDALVASGIPADRCWTTYNCFYALSPWKRIEVRGPAVRTPRHAMLGQFDIPAVAFVVGTVATMRPVKGIDLLLRAAIECADLHDTYWLLVGPVTDPLVSQLAADPRISPRVRLVGYRADAAELASSMDVFVMPSRAESLCQALLEAMAQGVCPVVSDAGGMKEVVRHEQDGLVVPRENVSALAAAIRRLRADGLLAARLAASAQARIADQCTAERMAERTLAIYRQVLSAGQASNAA
jgi:glycosyltransferase involved in cell wall biosynthesis